MPANSPPEVSVLILAGGQGSRLGGRDKGLMPRGGEPVAAYLAGLLRPLCNELLISCNRNHAQYRQWADRLVSDVQPDFPGPLAGILAGLEACMGRHLLVVPCDLPNLQRDLLEELLALALQQPSEPCLVRTGEDWQPLVCVLPRSSLASLQAYWDGGGRAPLRWLLSQPHRVMDLVPDDVRLMNANRPEDWAPTPGPKPPSQQ